MAPIAMHALVDLVQTRSKVIVFTYIMRVYVHNELLRYIYMNCEVISNVHGPCTYSVGQKFGQIPAM